MGRRVQFYLDLPEELFAQFREEELTGKARQALVMELLREHHLSQGKAAEILAITRHELFDLMSAYRVPAIDLHPEELKEELRKQFPNP